MSIVKERTQAVVKLIEQVKVHPMCGKFKDDGAYFLVIYPNGDFCVHGCRAEYRQAGKAVALQRLLSVMERHWIESFP